MVLVIGFIVPDVGTFLLLLIPPQESSRRRHPAAHADRGARRAGDRRRPDAGPDIEGGARRPRAIEAVPRGYPLTVLLAVLLVFLAVLAIWRKGFSLARRWTDAHVPMVVKPGAYDQVADDLDRALTAAGFDLDPEMPRPRCRCRPSGWPESPAGRRRPGPRSDAAARGPDLDILIYPMDILISGKPDG